jgi:hypothetical protein
MATATPSARRGPEAAEATSRVARAGRAAIRRQHPSSRRGAARKVSASVRRAHIPDTCAASGPDLLHQFIGTDPERPADDRHNNQDEGRDGVEQKKA